MHKSEMSGVLSRSYKLVKMRIVLIYIFIKDIKMRKSDSFDTYIIIGKDFV